MIFDFFMLTCYNYSVDILIFQFTLSTINFLFYREDLIMVTPNIYRTESYMYPLKSDSSRHYCVQGVSLDSVMEAARYRASLMLEANMNQDPYCTHYRTIELAIIPYPGKEDCYYLEDRSEIEIE